MNRIIITATEIKMKSFLRITFVAVLASLTSATETQTSYHVRESFSQLNSQVRPGHSLNGIAMNHADDPIINGVMERRSGEN